MKPKYKVGDHILFKKLPKQLRKELQRQGIYGKDVDVVIQQVNFIWEPVYKIGFDTTDDGIVDSFINVNCKYLDDYTTDEVDDLIKCNALLREFEIMHPTESTYLPYDVKITFSVTGSLSKHMGPSGRLNIKKVLKSIQTGDINIVIPSNL